MSTECVLNVWKRNENSDSAIQSLTEMENEQTNNYKKYLIIESNVCIYLFVFYSDHE